MSETETEHEEPTPLEAPDEPDEEEEATEAGKPAETPQEPAEGETEGSSPQGATPEQWEERFKKAERSFGVYTRRVTDLWEEDATSLLPVAISPSAPPGFLDVRDAGRVPEEVKAPILEFFGFAREQDYEPDPQTRECGTCKGKGKTRTGSRVPGRETRPCPACNGTGAEGLGAPPVAAPANGQSAQPFTLAPTGAEVVPEKDNWGEPRILPDGRENPNYGRQPQYKIAVEPWGITANLTAQDAPAGA